MRVAVAAVMAVGIASAACSSDSDPTAATGAGGTGGLGSGGDGVGASTGPGPPGPGPGSGGFQTGPMSDFDGEVVDEMASPVVDAPIQLCAEVCYLAFTNGGGAFTYDGVPSGHYKLDVRGPSESTLIYGAVNFPLDLLPDEALALDAPVVLPVTGPGVTLGAAPQDVTQDGLTLSIDPSTLMFPLGVDGGYVAATNVAPEHGPPNAPPSGTVVGWWALNPFGTLATSPIPVTIVADLGLAPGTPVELHTVNDQSGELELDVQTSVDADGLTIASSGSEGLRQITWVAVVTP